jgi:hypothetical protein
MREINHLRLLEAANPKGIESLSPMVGPTPRGPTLGGFPPITTTLKGLNIRLSTLNSSLDAGNQPLALTFPLGSPRPAPRALLFIRHNAMFSDAGIALKHQAPANCGALRQHHNAESPFSLTNWCGEKNLSGTRRYQADPAGTKRYDCARGLEFTLQRVQERRRASFWLSTINSPTTGAPKPWRRRVNYFPQVPLRGNIRQYPAIRGRRPISLPGIAA